MVAADGNGRVFVPLSFEPDEAWGEKQKHRVSGTVGSFGVRAVVERFGSGWAIVLGRAWLASCTINPGDRVEVTLAPEGPQRADLAPDLAAAFEAAPDAGAFFDSLAQFYRDLQPDVPRLGLNLDTMLRSTFPDRGALLPPRRATDLIRRMEADLLGNVFRWTGHFPDRTRVLVHHLAARADKLDLSYRADEEAGVTVAITTLVTSLAMNYVQSGSYFR